MISIKIAYGEKNIEVNMQPPNIFGALILVETLLSRIDETLVPDDSVPEDERERFDDVCEMVYRAQRHIITAIQFFEESNDREKYKWMDREILPLGEPCEYVESV